MPTYHLAIDIGASSGRHVLGEIKGGRLCLTEVYRFKNEAKVHNGRLCWDIGRLWEETLTGLQKCREIGKIPATVGVDTWACDFALLGKDSRRLSDCVSYRDSRTDGLDDELFRRIDRETLYGRTGIQSQPFNTIYQLLAIQKQEPELLRQAKTMLMIPEYLSFLLSGKMGHEYTNASTTGLLHLQTGDWDWEIIDELGLPRNLFGPLSPPGTHLGGLREDVRRQAGFDCRVILPCTHDTASAVLAAPIGPGSLFLSSGTWSLMGAERPGPITTPDSDARGFTNEGGYGGRIRYLKNIMGLWMIQRLRGESGGLSFDALCDAAQECEDFPSRVRVNDHRFFAPENMTEALRDACRASGQVPPETVGECMSCAYHSLADCYGESLAEMEALTGDTYTEIRIVGGGCQDDYLNRLTAKVCGKTVVAGPVEATAAGNILAQMLAVGERPASGPAQNMTAARQIITESFPMQKYL